MGYQGPKFTWTNKRYKTLIYLIPKNKDTSSLKNFRPIGLCNTSYKLVTKIIINRNKPFLRSIIGYTQTNFLIGRRTLDNATIMQEFITYFGKIKGKKVGMMLKINLEKAFDRPEWFFIRETLTIFNFH